MPLHFQLKARELMNTLAQSRNLTQDQLDDLAVPDLGLDTQGGRDLDFGGRRFRILLGPDLRPMVRDESGRPAEVDLWTGCYTPRELRLMIAAAGLELTSIASV